jgi:hypothetical protein
MWFIEHEIEEKELEIQDRLRNIVTLDKDIQLILTRIKGLDEIL